MIFSKENKLLVYLYSHNHYDNGSFCSESDIQMDLKLNYKQIHGLAMFWQQRNCLKYSTQRGGISSYKLTAYGVEQARKINEKKKRVVLAIIFVIISGLIVFLGY